MRSLGLPRQGRCPERQQGSGFRGAAALVPGKLAASFVPLPGGTGGISTRPSASYCRARLTSRGTDGAENALAGADAVGRVHDCGVPASTAVDDVGALVPRANDVVSGTGEDCVGQRCTDLGVGRRRRRSATISLHDSDGVAADVDRGPWQANARAIAALIRPGQRLESGPSRGIPSIEGSRSDVTPARFDHRTPNIARVYPRVLLPESNSPPPQFPSVRRPSPQAMCLSARGLSLVQVRRVVDPLLLVGEKTRP
jgi:hypothetical protein